MARTARTARMARVARTSRGISSWTAAVLALALGGCLGGDAIACDFRADAERCQERTGTQAANPLAFEATCETAGGSYLDGACPDDGIVGGCKVSRDVVDWYYAPRTTDEVRAECPDDFVAP